MKTIVQSSFAERTGRALGRTWWKFTRLERKACGWLAAQGLPPGVAKVLPLIFRLAVLGALLYATFWLGCSVRIHCRCRLGSTTGPPSV